MADPEGVQWVCSKIDQVLELDQKFTALVPWVLLWSMILAFHGHTHLLEIKIM